MGKGYELAAIGRKWVDPNKIIKDAPNLGSDLHKQLLVKTIEKLHEENMLVIAPKENDSFDLIAYPQDKKKKYLLDDANRQGYEIQTTAREDSVMANAAKRDRLNMSITLVTYDEKIMDEIKRLTSNKD